MKNKPGRWVLDVLFPRRCAICDEPAAFGKGICRECQPRIKYITGSVCMKCGRKKREDENSFCTDCSRKKHYYRQGKVLCEYEELADSLFRFKYGGRQEYAIWYAEALYHKFGSWLHAAKVQAIVPVPIHKSRKRKRGYNQAQLVARELSRLSGIPWKDQLVKRCKKTVPLKGLTPLERQNNLKKAFIIGQNDVKLDTIVIIDDIYTTGSTIDSIGKVLLEAGVSNIYFLALAAGSGN